MDNKKQKWLNAIEDGMESSHKLVRLSPQFKEDLKSKLLTGTSIERPLPHFYIFMAAASFSLLLLTNVWAYRSNLTSTTSDKDGYIELINSYQLISPTLGSTISL